MPTRARRASARRPTIERVLERSSSVAARLRRSRVARRVGLRRITAVVLAVVVGCSVADTVGQASGDRARWGSTRSVLVATEDVAAGEALDAGNTEIVEWPVGLLPEGALEDLPTARRSNVDVTDGEPILESRLADGSLGRLAARLPDGSAAVTFPRTDSQPVLDLGDRVDLYARVDDMAGTASARVASGATVVHLDPHAVTLAVDDDEVRAAAAASMSQGVAIVVLR